MKYAFASKKIKNMKISEILLQFGRKKGLEDK